MSRDLPPTVEESLDRIGNEIRDGFDVLLDALCDVILEVAGPQDERIGTVAPDPTVAGQTHHSHAWSSGDVGTFPLTVDVRPDGFVLAHEDVINDLLRQVGFRPVVDEPSWPVSVPNYGERKAPSSENLYVERRHVDPMPADLPDRILTELREVKAQGWPEVRGAVWDGIMGHVLDVVETEIAKALDPHPPIRTILGVEPPKVYCGARPGGQYPPAYDACAILVEPGGRHDGLHHDASGRTFAVSA